MPKVNVYNLERASVGELELSSHVFGAPVSEVLLYEVVKAQLASRRAGSASTKGRAEVAGSTRKLYRQKGTGRARHGGIRAPIYVGGGKAHGPRPRSYAYRPPRKMRLGALRCALSLKLQEGRLTVVSDLSLSQSRTKVLEQILGRLDVLAGSLLVDSKGNQPLALGVRNLQGHDYLPPEGVNVYDVLRHPHLVLTQGAVAALESRATGNRK
ncbi:MAG: 50S ribosomal protein L4 [Proteobacteria bacterium]|nr:50S ribosomal protein L4 [Pseudomonadota bacterium]